MRGLIEIGFLTMTFLVVRCGFGALTGFGALVGFGAFGVFGRRIIKRFFGALAA